MRMILLAFVAMCVFIPSLASANETYTQNVCGSNRQVGKALITQIPHLKGVTLRKTNIVFPYAIQHWTDDEAGGAVLLKYDPAKGWVVLEGGGGGGIDLSILRENHVPPDKATQLMAELNFCR